MPACRDVAMIDSIRSDDDFGVSKRVDRTGPPADEGASPTAIMILLEHFLEVAVGFYFVSNQNLMK